MTFGIVRKIEPLHPEVEKKLGLSVEVAREVACLFSAENSASRLLVEEVLDAAADFPSVTDRKRAIQAAISWLNHLAHVHIRFCKEPELTGRDLEFLRTYAWWLQKE